MLEFRFIYIGLRKTIKDIFKLVEKKMWSGKNREESGHFKLLDQSTPWFRSACYKILFYALWMKNH